MVSEWIQWSPGTPATQIERKINAETVKRKRENFASSWLLTFNALSNIHMLCEKGDLMHLQKSNDSGQPTHTVQADLSRNLLLPVYFLNSFPNTPF